jgi:hypothetical protein
LSPDRVGHRPAGPTEADEKRLGPATSLNGPIALSFVIGANTRDLQFSGPFLETRYLIPATTRYHLMADSGAQGQSLYW